MAQKTIKEIIPFQGKNVLDVGGNTAVTFRFLYDARMTQGTAKTEVTIGVGLLNNDDVGLPIPAIAALYLHLAVTGRNNDNIPVIDSSFYQAEAITIQVGATTPYLEISDKVIPVAPLFMSDGDVRLYTGVLMREQLQAGDTWDHNISLAYMYIEYVSGEA